MQAAKPIQIRQLGTREICKIAITLGVHKTGLGYDWHTQTCQSQGHFIVHHRAVLNAIKTRFRIRRIGESGQGKHQLQVTHTVKGNVSTLCSGRVYPLH